MSTETKRIKLKLKGKEGHVICQRAASTAVAAEAAKAFPLPTIIKSLILILFRE